MNAAQRSQVWCCSCRVFVCVTCFSFCRLWCCSCRIVCGVVLAVCLCVWPVSLFTGVRWERLSQESHISGSRVQPEVIYRGHIYLCSIDRVSQEVHIYLSFYIRPHRASSHCAAPDGIKSHSAGMNAARRSQVWSCSCRVCVCVCVTPKEPDSRGRTVAEG